jgi:hypothetical protein
MGRYKWGMTEVTPLDKIFRLWVERREQKLQLQVRYQVEEKNGCKIFTIKDMSDCVKA